MFGIHIKKNFELGTYHSLENAVDTIISKYDLNTCQVFLYGPQSRRQNEYDEKSMLALSDKTNIYVHTTYLTDGYWKSVEDNAESKLKGYYKHIQDQLTATENIGGKGIVVHITRKPIQVIVRGMELMEKNIKQTSAKIILEFRAMKPLKNCSYERIEMFNNLAKSLGHIKLDWGFCLDTSHMWSSGINMADFSIVSSWFDGIASPNKVALIHLNAASNETFSVGKDIHQVPFSKGDDIWGKLPEQKLLSNPKDKKAIDQISKSSLGYLLLWAKKNDIPIIGEFNRGSAKEFNDSIVVLKLLIETLDKSPR